MRKIAAVAVCALVWSTAFAQDDAERREPREVDIDGGEPPAEQACFNVREIDTFTAIDDDYLYLRARRDRHYLLTMAPGCIGLRDSFQIAVSNQLSRVCSVDFAEVTYRAFGELETCRIARVESVENEAAAKILAELRARGGAPRE